MPNVLNHMDALEYAAGFQQGLQSGITRCEELLEKWHSKWDQHEPGPLSYHLAYLRGLESAKIVQIKGPVADIGNVTLDQSGG